MGSDREDGMKPLYISATLKDSGKTSVSVGLMQLLAERGADPGYCKPVGQHYVQYCGKNIDEDGVLIHQVFDLPDEPYYLSPIAIERGFTTKFIFHPDVTPLERQILECRDRILEIHSMLIVEGTGHAGVGSCFGLSNARVAQLLGAKVVIVTSGGIGRPIDEIALSLSLFADYGVDVVGVILNKVLAAKYEKIKTTVGRGLENLGTRLLGAIPYEPALTRFTVGQVAEEFQYEVLCGADWLSNRIETTVVAAMEPQHVLEYIQDKTLVIIPGDRLDNILISLLALAESSPHDGGLILTGGFDPHPRLMPLMRNSKVPVLISKEDTFSVSAKMADIGFKIRSYDTDKIARLHELVRDHVDIDSVLGALEE